MEIFFECLEHRADFICHYNQRQSDAMAKKMLDMLTERNEDLLPRKVELISVLYKWTSPFYQNAFYDRIMEMFNAEKVSAAMVVAICNFIWINNKVFSSDQKRGATLALKCVSGKIDAELQGTVHHTQYSLTSDFFSKRNVNSKVCLFIPEYLSGLSFLQPPLGLMSISSILSKNGISCDVFDNRVWHYSEQQQLELLEQYDIILVNSTPIDQVQNYFVDYRYALTIKVTKQIKNRFPEKRIVFCGSHGTVRRDLIEKEKIANYILQGEYEYQSAELIKCLVNNDLVESLPNISYWNGISYQHTNTSEEHLHPQLDENIFPDYSCIDLNGYYGNYHYKGVNVKKEHWSILMTSRGCPFKCIFCYKFFGNRIRRYSLEHVLCEMHRMKEHKIDSFFIIDQLFTSDKGYVKELCLQMIHENFDFHWSCQTRIDQIDLELLLLMKQAGCNGIWMGVESVTDGVLSLNQKGTTQAQIVDCVKMVKSVNINFNTFFMLGMPGETVQSLSDMYSFISENDLPCTKSFMVCTPRYGTKMCEMAQKEHSDIMDDFYMLNKYKGLVNNSVSQNDIEKTILRLSALVDNKDK